MTTLFVPQLPETEDPDQQGLRERLGSSDPELRAEAALQLGAAWLYQEPEAARTLLRLALAGTPLTVARAHLRLGDDAQRAGRRADARDHLEAARATLQGADVAAEVRLAVMIDIGPAFVRAGQHEAGVAVLQAVDTELRSLLHDKAPADEGVEALRALRAHANLKLGQIQCKSSPAAANAALRLAAATGTGSVAATAAVERGWLLEHRIGGYGPLIEEQYRKAAELNDPVASPRALVSLGDLLWRNGRPESAREEWTRAAELGDEDIAERVRRRLDGVWPYDGSEPAPKPLAAATPLRGVEPPTVLGRVASGRSADPVAKPRRVVVVGCGTGGHYLLPGLEHDYEVMGFVDDNATDKVGDYEVLGTIDDLEDVLSALEADGKQVHQVLFAAPTASGETRRRVLRAALRCRTEVRCLPPMFELRRAHPLVPQLRPIEVYETYGDFPWTINRHAAAVARGRRVAIVGAAHRLGRELARRAAHGQARHLLLLDEAPVRLLKVTSEMRHHRDFLDCDARILDPSDEFGVDEVFAEFRPEVVFHVCTLEHIAEEVLPQSHMARATVRAAQVTASAAKGHGAEEYVLVSADRAAHRSVPFDMAKALAEHAVLRLGDKHTEGRTEPSRLRLVSEPAPSLRLSVLRLPNVWSKDSPILGRLTAQLADGGPIEVNHVAQRCFVTSWQAAEAVLRLVGAPHSGGIFALTRGETVSLRELAERLIWINGLRSGLDVDVIDRPGADLKAGTHLAGDAEEICEKVAHGMRRIHQDEALLEELGERLDLLEGWLRDGESRRLADALRVSPDGEPGALAG